MINLHREMPCRWIFGKSAHFSRFYGGMGWSVRFCAFIALALSGTIVNCENYKYERIYKLLCITLFEKIGARSILNGLKDFT